MGFVRRRYYFWLFKAYLKKWNTTIYTALIGGVVAFFLFFFLFNFYFLPLLQKKVQKIGYVGTYTTTNLPRDVISDISYGLTLVEEDGTIHPGASYKWEVKNGGKDFIFYIKRGQYLGNSELKSSNLNLSFEDATLTRLDEYKVQFGLKEPYAPFLISASKPILSKRFQGLGDYKVKNIDLNAGFVKSITLQNKEAGEEKKIITFYPTSEALKLAYVLGDIDVAKGVLNTELRGYNLNSWKNTTIERSTDYSRLLTLFYNNSDSLLSDKRLRQALSYAIPPKFDGGERAYSPIAPKSAFFAKGPNYGISDLEIARSLISNNKDLKGETIEISTPQEYENEANKIALAWEQIRIKPKIKIVSGVPDTFQVLIYPVNLPADPDQYTLWHSNGANNIIHYKKNARIDKLLEDGRSTIDQEVRAIIYADFQKYLADDAPAAFLYFPYVYTVKRK